MGFITKLSKLVCSLQEKEEFKDEVIMSEEKEEWERYKSGILQETLERESKPIAGGQPRSMQIFDDIMEDDNGNSKKIEDLFNKFSSYTSHDTNHNDQDEPDGYFLLIYIYIYRVDEVDDDFAREGEEEEIGEGDDEIDEDEEEDEEKEDYKVDVRKFEYLYIHTCIYINIA